MTQTVASGQSSLMRAAVLFVAGFISVLAFHQLLWAGLLGAGIVPAGAYEPWSLASTPPFGLPSVISMAFWGGLWAILIGTILRNAQGPSYWLGWFAWGALGPTLVTLFIVTPLKGEPFADMLLARFVIGFVVNGVFGLGSALLLSLAKARR